MLDIDVSVAVQEGLAIDDSMKKQASQVWAMLDELAETDPEVRVARPTTPSRAVERPPPQLLPSRHT